MQSIPENNRYTGRVIQKLIQPADNSTLIVFRVCFGFLLFYHCLAFAFSGELHKNFIEPPFTFTYIGFEFLQPLPGAGMYVYFGIMAVLALMIIAGAFYRFAITGFTVLWALVYLMQKSNYNNHYYLMLLLCFLMCFMPAAGFFSVDAKRNPGLKKNTCARWVYFLFMAQTGVIYLYAALGKLNADWLSGRFIALQFAPLTTHRFTGPVYGNPYFQMLVVYGGFVFDLLIVPFLCLKKTRYYAFVLFCCFHLFNSYSFRIGIFPYLSIGMGLFFLSPEKMRQLFFKNKAAVMQQADLTVFVPALQKILLQVMFIYLFVQVLLPLRPALFPGPVFWTEEGYRMSWKMMLRTKTGRIHFKVADPVSGKTWQHDPASKFAASHVTWLAICPDIAWQYAQRLKKDYKKMGYPAVAVYAIDSVSLNKNPPQLLIDTTVNLAAVPWHPFRHSWWILPFTKQP